MHSSSEYQPLARLAITQYSSETRTLIKLLSESHDPTVLAVAAHDVGQYVKHYERGKKSVPSPLF